MSNWKYIATIYLGLLIVTVFFVSTRNTMSWYSVGGANSLTVESAKSLSVLAENVYSLVTLILLNKLLVYSDAEVIYFQICFL